MFPPAFVCKPVMDFCMEREADPTLLRRALVLAGVMRWFAEFRGYAGAADTWAAAGLLRRAAQGKLRAFPDIGVDDDVLRIVGKTAVADADAQAPLTEEDELSCLLVTLDHLSGLILAIAASRPKGSVRDLKVSAVQKKFRDTRLAPESNRTTIIQGARRMRWEIGDLTSKTIKAIRAYEEDIRESMQDIE